MADSQIWHQFVRGGKDWIDHELNHIILAIILCFLTFLVIRISSCLPAYRSKRLRKPLGVTKTGQRTVKTMVYFGSGGHTAEMIRLLQNLDPVKYQPLIFAIGHTDITTQASVRSASLRSEPYARWLRVYRNREVKQSWITTFFTTLWSLIQALYTLHKHRPQLLICNGPGTCLSLAYALFALKVIGLVSSDSTVVFIESFCRTHNFSLTGRLIYPIADRFVVHWAQLMEKYPRAEYIGQVM